jgi:hypothetical protein
MAKKYAGGNKSQAIREALEANPDKGPKEIAEIVQAQGFKVNAQYVSIIKSAAKKKAGGPGRTVRVKRAGGRRLAGGMSSSGSPLQSALEFIQACGGLEQAKSVLVQVEQLRSVV